VKPISFLGDSREAIRAFPDAPRYRAGVELRAVQSGLEPDDWKPMKTVAPGVREIRIRDKAGAFRIIYLATLADRVLVLHAFQKKTQQTMQKDIDLAAKRLREWKVRQ
jgi:phage-related protein